MLSNAPPDGGYGVFNELHGDNYLPLWLQGAGYRTSYIGKFENGYAEPDEYGTTPTDVPRGWDDWHVLAPSRAQYFNYTLNQNGTLRQYSDADEDYSTDVFTQKARNFIRSSSRIQTPFYLELGYAAPHGGGGGDPGRSCNRAAVPAPRDLGTLKKKAKGSLPPSFNEAEITDKPSPIADHPPLTAGQIQDTLRKRRCAWESLLAVDDSVGTIMKELQRDKVRRNTYVFYLSDNGFMRGEHRVRDNKRFLYEESARVPFIARGPGIPHGESSDDVVVNADLTSTILGLSGAPAGLTQDGESLMPSLTNPDLENGRAILLEAYAGAPILGVRTSRYLYTEWDTGKAQPEKELYDTYLRPVRAQPTSPTRWPTSRSSPSSATSSTSSSSARATAAAPRPPASSPSPPVAARTAARCRRSSPTWAPPTTRAWSASPSAPARCPSARTPRRPSRRRSRSRPCATSSPTRRRCIAQVLFEDGRRLAFSAALRACGR